ncbi:restriction endonuclease subunit S [Pseudomonas glycinae]|uniref:restriction endonuclease subunit S n=1 Tax=Pseudomonas glycinae TaxID=1785145 RepID=UPI0018D8E82E|nr:restriction endonuclease subunit S [Pseudomonas glycinae]MBH3408837.1 restriction endonuclease subunit S [Pseudomonas glycinae]
MAVKPGYKQTEVGVIPEEWEVKPLQEVGKFAKGKGLLKEDIKTSGRIPAIPYTALYTDFSELLNYDHIKWFVDDEAQTYIANEPCVLIASSSNMAANTGKASALTRATPVAIGREVIIFKTAFDCGYISFLLSTAQYRQTTLSLARGTTIKHLYPATFQSYKIALPPLPEQRAITKALSEVDALLGALDRLVAKKRDLKQASMQQLLSGEIRLPGFHGEWESKQLGEVATFLKGKGLPKSELVQDGTAPCIHYGELFTQYPETIGEIFSRTNGWPDCFLSVANDVLMPTSDVTPRGLAKASCVTIDGVILGGDILVIRSDKLRVFGPFLSYVIRREEGQVLRLVTGSTVYHLYGSDMKRFIFSLPPLSEQNAIAAVLSDMDAELTALEQRLAKTRALKQGMMQELLTGRTRLL